MLTPYSNSVPELLTLREVCELLKVHQNTLRQWDAKGILKAVRIGQRSDRRYIKDDVLKMLNIDTNNIVDSKMKSYKPTVISLFSGCSGIDLGFKLAGYDIKFANDIDK